MRKMRIKLFLLSASVAFLAAQISARADILGVAEPYNAFIFQNKSLQNTDSVGALAVGGNAMYSSYSVASGLSNSTTNLVVGGKLTLSNGSIHGNAYVGGTATLSGANVTGTLSSHVPTASLPINFAQAQTQLTQTSQTLAALTNTGSLVDNYGSITFTGNAAGMNVFSITENMLASGNGITINIPSNAFAIVNVTGSSSLSLPNVGFNLPSANVLWNLSTATSISYTAWNGSILAPSANVTSNYGDLNGTLVAKSLTGYGELHNFKFDHSIPSNTPGFSSPTVPLPASVEGGLVLLGGMGIGGFVRRGRKVSA